ncbi:MAG: hypothetical protein A2017_02315 [Lentisphaerae bacterium GWF2_44_16]|nr:MAG: hypothetical protein A2017_02315 [Lentisphaerae bacterium GWF2_44_16]
MKILIADDDPVLLKLLCPLLRKWGHEALCVSDGMEALQILSGKDEYLQIAILDWVMPGIDGIDICKKIRKNSENKFIYIILLTGRNEEKDIINGLDAGADDYITKPIRTEELKSRLAAGVRTVNYERKLREFNRNLQEKNDALEKYSRIMETLAEERAKKLIHSERLSTLGELAAGMAHEVNNYLAPISGYADLLKLYIDNMPLGEAEKIKYSEYIDGINRGAGRIRKLIERVRIHGRKTASERIDTDVRELLVQSLELCVGKLKRVKVERDLTEMPLKVNVMSQEIEQVFVNIFKNAAEAMSGREGSVLWVSSRFEADIVRVIIEDNGPGVPEEHIENIWEAFFTTKSAEDGTGLGLSISKGIIENHGGSIKAENRKEGGARFIIELPKVH